MWGSMGPKLASLMSSARRSEIGGNGGLQAEDLARVGAGEGAVCTVGLH